MNAKPISVRFDETQLRFLTGMARKQRGSAGAVIRQAVDMFAQAAQHAGAMPPPDGHKAEPEMAGCH